MTLKSVLKRVKVIALLPSLSFIIYLPRNLRYTGRELTNRKFDGKCHVRGGSAMIGCSHNKWFLMILNMHLTISK